MAGPLYPPTASDYPRPPYGSYEQDRGKTYQYGSGEDALLSSYKPPDHPESRPYGSSPPGYHHPSHYPSSYPPLRDAPYGPSREFYPRPHSRPDPYAREYEISIRERDTTYKVREPVDPRGREPNPRGFPVGYPPPATNYPPNPSRYAPSSRSMESRRDRSSSSSSEGILPPSRHEMNKGRAHGLNKYFIEGDGINREVLTHHIEKMLGALAIARPDTYKVRLHLCLLSLES